MGWNGRQVLLGARPTTACTTRTTRRSPTADDTLVAQLGNACSSRNSSSTTAVPTARRGGPKVGDVQRRRQDRRRLRCRRRSPTRRWAATGTTSGGRWRPAWRPGRTGSRSSPLPSGAVNFKAQAENAWSIEVTDGAGSSPQVHGLGRMAGYNILGSGFQRMYLAQIDATAAGKTIEIDLFDPGDVSGDAYLRILSPDGNAYNYATFSYSSDANCASGNSDACSGVRPDCRSRRPRAGRARSTTPGSRS